MRKRHLLGLLALSVLLLLAGCASVQSSDSIHHRVLALNGQTVNVSHLADQGQGRVLSVAGRSATAKTVTLSGAKGTAVDLKLGDYPYSTIVFYLIDGVVIGSDEVMDDPYTLSFELEKAVPKGQHELNVITFAGDSTSSKSINSNHRVTLLVE